MPKPKRTKNRDNSINPLLELNRKKKKPGDQQMDYLKSLAQSIVEDSAKDLIELDDSRSSSPEVDVLVPPTTSLPEHKLNRLLFRTLRYQLRGDLSDDSSDEDRPPDKKAPKKRKILGRKKARRPKSNNHVGNGFEWSKKLKNPRVVLNPRFEEFPELVDIIDLTAPIAFLPPSRTATTVINLDDTPEPVSVENDSVSIIDEILSTDTLSQPGSSTDTLGLPDSIRDILGLSGSIIDTLGLSGSSTDTLDLPGSSTDTLDLPGSSTDTLGLPGSSTDLTPFQSITQYLMEACKKTIKNLNDSMNATLQDEVMVVDSNLAPAEEEVPSTVAGLIQTDNTQNNQTKKRTKHECPICLEDFSQQQIIVATPCGHVFCKTCIDLHLDTNKTCPACRKSVNKKKLIKLFF